MSDEDLLSDVEDRRPKKAKRVPRKRSGELYRVTYVNNVQHVELIEDEATNLGVKILLANDPLADEFRSNSAILKDLEWEVVGINRLGSGDAALVDLYSGQIVVRFERKTNADALASLVNDCRFEIQRDNMTESGARNYVIFESEEKSDLTEGLLETLTVKNGFHVRYASNTYQTMDRILVVAGELSAGKPLRNSRGCLVEKKRSDVVRSRLTAYQISCSLGVSLDAGMAVKDRYGSMAGLVKAWEKTGSISAARALLQDISYLPLPEPTAVQVTRIVRPVKIGPTIAARIADECGVADLFAGPDHGRPAAASPGGTIDLSDD